jgi:hypothetical protein
MLRHSVLIGRNNRSRQIYPHLIYPKGQTTVTINIHPHDKQPTHFVTLLDNLHLRPQQQLHSFEPQVRARFIVSNFTFGLLTTLIIV